MERKCPTCGEWNSRNSTCLNCGNSLDYKEIRQKEIDFEKEKISAKADNKIFATLKKLGESRFLLARILYKILYSIWFVFAMIISSFLYIIAAGPG